MATTTATVHKRGPETSEHNDDSRRVRARVACARCRTKKDRCDGIQPQCSNCLNAEQPCQYVPPTKSRGLPGGYVRGLEKLWAVMVQKVQGLDDTVRRVMQDNEEELLRIWNHHKYGNDLHATWKKSIVFSELDKLLNREKEDNGETMTSLHSMPGDVYTMPPAFTIAQIPILMRLPQSASSLIDHYFKYTHCWFPILDRPYTLRKYYEITRSSDPLQLKSSDLAHMWAICAYTKQQMLHSGAASSTTGEEPTASEMRTTARSLIPDESGPYCLGHVQALLLLAILDLGTTQTSSAKMLVGFAIRVLLDGIDPAEARHPTWKAALQGCFILDTLISMRLKKPPHLRTEHLIHIQLLVEDGHEEWEPWQGPVRDTSGHRSPAFVISCFNHLTELCKFANGLLKSEFGHSIGEPSSVQDYSGMSTLQELAEKYRFKVVEVELRPPHQMLLQACHTAIMATALPATDPIQEEEGKRFFNILGLFEHAWNRPDRGGIPSILTTLCHLINQLPLRHLVSPLTNETISRLASTWPSFPNSSKEIAEHSAILIPSASRGMLQQPETSAFAASGAWPSDSASYQPTRLTGSNETAEDEFQAKVVQYPTIALFSGSSEQTSQMTSYGATARDVGQNTFDPVLMNDSSIGVGGDALFYEMAPQWTIVDRTQDFQDLGFADYSTFEAWNDNRDRLTEGYIGPAFGDNQGGVYGTQTALPEGDGPW